MPRHRKFGHGTIGERASHLAVLVKEKDELINTIHRNENEIADLRNDLEKGHLGNAMFSDADMQEMSRARLHATEARVKNLRKRLEKVERAIKDDPYYNTWTMGLGAIRV